MHHPLDRLDPFPRHVGGEDETGEHGPAVDEHRARAALAELAAVLGAGEGAFLAQDFQQGYGEWGRRRGDLRR